MLARTYPLRTIKWKGGTLPPQPFLTATSVTVQVIKSDVSECWQAVLPAPASVDDGSKFKDKIP